MPPQPPIVRDPPRPPQQPQTQPPPQQAETVVRGKDYPAEPPVGSIDTHAEAVSLLHSLPNQPMPKSSEKTTSNANPWSTNPALAQAVINRFTTQAAHLTVPGTNVTYKLKAGVSKAGADDCVTKAGEGWKNGTLRFYDEKTQRYMVTNSVHEGCAAGYTPKRPVFRLFNVSTGNGRTIYRCKDGDKHFASLDSRCEGKTFVDALGKMKKTEEPGTLPLYSATDKRSGDQFLTVDDVELDANFEDKQVIGFVRPPNAPPPVVVKKGDKIIREETAQTPVIIGASGGGSGGGAPPVSGGGSGGGSSGGGATAGAIDGGSGGGRSTSSVSQDPAPVVETSAIGCSMLATCSYTFQLAHPRSTAVSFKWTTNDTAYQNLKPIHDNLRIGQPERDYTSMSGQVTFAPGETYKRIELPRKPTEDLIYIELNFSECRIDGSDVAQNCDSTIKVKGR